MMSEVSNSGGFQEWAGQYMFTFWGGKLEEAEALYTAFIETFRHQTARGEHLQLRCVRGAPLSPQRPLHQGRGTSAGGPLVFSSGRQHRFGAHGT